MIFLQGYMRSFISRIFDTGYKTVLAYNKNIQIQGW